MSKSLKFIFPLLLIGLFLVSYAALADSGQSSDSNKSGDQSHKSVSDQQENADHRQVQVDYNPSGKSVDIQSENHYNGTNTQIDVEVSANDGIQVNFQYSGHLVNQTESHLSIKMKATRLVEFIDNKTAGIPNAFDANDTVVKSFNLADANWNFTVTNSTIGNNTLWTMTAMTIINTNATLTFQFLLTNGFATLSGNNTLAPNLIKFTMALKNYIYSNSQSQLALQTIFKSDLHTTQISNQTEDHTDGLTHNNESAVNFANGTTSGFFSWADNYTVDGKSMPIVTSPAVSVDKEDNNYNQLYFTFKQGRNITWDPKIGVTRATTSPYDIQQALINSSALASLSPTKSTPGFEFLVALSSMSVVAIYSKKHFKK